MAKSFDMKCHIPVPMVAARKVAAVSLQWGKSTPSRLPLPSFHFYSSLPTSPSPQTPTFPLAFSLLFSFSNLCHHALARDTVRERETARDTHA